jgi:hypothetical protein
MAKNRQNVAFDFPATHSNSIWTIPKRLLISKSGSVFNFTKEKTNLFLGAIVLVVGIVSKKVGLKSIENFLNLGCYVLYRKWGLLRSKKQITGKGNTDLAFSYSPLFCYYYFFTTFWYFDLFNLLSTGETSIFYSQVNMMN